MDDVITFAAFAFLVLCAGLFMYLIGSEWGKR